MTNVTQNIVIKYPREATIFASVCAILFCIVGVVGNLVTVVALIRCPKLRTHATTAFVLSLCISDLLFCSVNLPLTASRYIHEAWTLGDALCKLFPVLFYGNVAVSLLNMVAITLNRYVLISYHQYYNQLYSKASIWLQLLCTWGFAFLIMLPSLLGVWGQLGLNPSTFSCTILEKDGKSPKKILFLIAFVLPCVVIISSYSCIFWRVQKSRRKLKAHQQATKKEKRSSRRERDDSRLTKLMLIIFICFVLCFLPLMLVNVFDDDVKYPVLHVLASILAWASSVINPFIYAASNRQYRSAYSKLFRIVKSSVVFSESKQFSNNSLKSRDKNGQSVNYKPNPGSS
ncbi:protein trapped in endoderm-1 [Tribolium castaneum]|uniref:Protein trapped in endoderm-1-like Protein n=1 Tax=Tribolium castaneum TaxID=7070 RepID=D6W7A8_TRICA|nr:PREDICTED: protein trapped in endoderm-1 [Tribolium castaneum]EFA11575.1 Protein trapped in endoderm-1-like Protein [Tribolium castaneum]|eukprot:XP_971005.2 PREDICTED: protein trapped in endoderm-1 [Tribolium castaneum]